MNVCLTPDQQTRLAELADRTGKNADELVQEAVDHLLDERSQFLGDVEKGFASLDRDEYVTHEAVGERIDRLLRP